jgi:hypothetical protein
MKRVGLKDLQDPYKGCHGFMGLIHNNLDSVPKACLPLAYRKSGNMNRRSPATPQPRGPTSFASAARLPDLIPNFGSSAFLLIQIFSRLMEKDSAVGVSGVPI